MTALVRGLMELLIHNQQWDYCVIWKLGDDPSRFIEWGACCCSGGRVARGIRIKDENDAAEEDSIGDCRDDLIKHPVATPACRKLARLPSVIPLYSGIHGDVVISKRPKWSDASDSDDEPNGTQVLIPVSWGLIELFSTKQVKKDEKIIDCILAHLKFSDKQENMAQKGQINFSQLYDPQASVCVENWLPSLNSPSFVPKIPQPMNNHSFEGSPTCSGLSNEHQPLQLGSDHVLNGMPFQNSTRENVASQSRNLRLKRMKDRCFASNENVGRQKGEKGPFKSKNLETERRRRKRIREGLMALRTLVPNITKMDKSAILGDAADYIEELLATIQSCYDELRALEEEDCNEAEAKQVPPLLVREKTPIVVEVEVIQIGTKDFLVRLVCKQTRGGFSRLMEVIDCLGLEVRDVNITTANGSVLNVLKVEAKTGEVEACALKHSLMKLIN